MFSYLLINLFTLAGPMARSFEPRIAYWRKWKALFPAIGLTMLLFITWDAVFTHWGVWGFTPAYLVGIDLINLPIEEWLFFITIPYACLFIYEVLNLFIRRDVLGPASTSIAVVFMLLGGLMLLLYPGRLYTQSASLVMIILLAINLWVLRSPWLGRFFLAYLVSLIPFVLVNGILTGAVTAEPIVWYNDDENMGMRFITIPLEDFFYGLDLMLLNLMLYERFKRKWCQVP
ncbi:MAG TPA: lycopene cyclase domain-containing protein [Bacteroidia bacterium]|nr:lycopene cyclase domain-containing protein [Bacteroidia bacterium]